MKGDNMKRFAVLATTLFLLLMSSSPAFADTPFEQRDYIIEVGDGQCVFVMLIQDGYYGYGSDVEFQDEEIRAKYSQSGLYRVDDSNDALYTGNWYAFRVDITSDCKHLVR